MKRILAILIVGMLVLSSCGDKESVEKVIADKDGIKNYTNTSTPADPNVKLDLKKRFSISGENEDSLASFNQPFSMTADKDGNIYILDMSSMSLKKFDKEGIFTKSIGRRGQGPGELSGPTFVAILDDTLSVMSQRLRKISRFTLDGEFINDKRLEMDIQLPKTFDNENVIGYTVEVDQENQAIKFSLSLLNKDFKITNTFEKRDIGFQDFSSGKVKISDLLITFEQGKYKVYLSENDDNQYKINEFDLTGKKTATIKKEYRKTKNSEEEQEAFMAYIEQNNSGITNDNMKLDNFKKAFTSMYYDKYGRLLVVPEIDRSKDPEGSYIDIFKDGVFQNRVDFEVNKGNVNLGSFSFMQKQIFFVGDRMYVINMEEMIVDVYDY
jgi:hypothetical protein